MKGKLYYFYATMNSGKSANLILKEFQFRQAGSTTFALKPKTDTRTEGTIKSRAIKDELPCHVFDENTNLCNFVFQLIGLNLAETGKLHDICIFVDEIQFASKAQVEQLFKLTRSHCAVKVFCYGLKTNYMNELFEASERLLVLADSVEEIKSKCACKCCDNKATTHIRYVGDEIILDGNGIQVGDIEGQDKYVAVCQTCYYELIGDNNGL